jgi:cysteine desulfurase
MLYFDQAATTEPWDEVVETVAATMRGYYANPSSLHRMGQQAGMLVQAAREQVAKLLNVAASEVVFTSGGTESNALAILGVARQFGATRGKHVITTAVEHASVMAQMARLQEDGFELTVLPVDAQGCVSVADVANALRADTILVSVGWVSSEVGSVQPIAEIGALLRGWPKVLFHVDAVQAVGKLAVDMHTSGVDLLSVSAHKFRGPRGCGVLCVRDGVTLAPMLVGGGQEAGLRAGTPNTPAIAGTAKALRLTLAQRAAALAHVQTLKRRLHAHLHAEALQALGVRTTGGDADHPQASPYIVHFTAAGLKAQVILHALEQRGVIVSSRSACSSRDEQPSATLLAMGRTRDEALAGIRVSLSPEHSVQDIDQLACTIQQVISQLRNEAAHV